MSYGVLNTILPSEVRINTPFEVYARIDSDSLQSVTVTQKVYLNDEKYLPDYDEDLDLTTGTMEYYISTIEAPDYSANPGDMIEICIDDVCESREVKEEEPEPAPDIVITDMWLECKEYEDDDKYYTCSGIYRDGDTVGDKRESWEWVHFGWWATLENRGGPGSRSYTIQATGCDFGKGETNKEVTTAELDEGEELDVELEDVFKEGYGSVEVCADGECIGATVKAPPPWEQILIWLQGNTMGVPNWVIAASGATGLVAVAVAASEEGRRKMLMMARE